MLVFAAMNQGESKRALKVVRDMLADVPKDWVAKPENAAVADGFVAAPMEVMKRFGMWDEILQEPGQSLLACLGLVVGHVCTVILPHSLCPVFSRNSLHHLISPSSSTPFGENPSTTPRMPRP
jgi:hypothetical protein